MTDNEPKTLQEAKAHIRELEAALRYAVMQVPELMEVPGIANALTPPDSEPQGEVVVTTNERGDAVAVTRQDEKGEILSVIWERDSEDDLPVSGEEFLRRYPQLASTKTTDSEPAEEAEKCLVCDGTGNLYGRQPEGMYGYLPCHNCKGTGKPPMREPAEGEGGDDVCMCGLTYSEHTPDDDHSFTPMREHYDTTEQQDAMLERREAQAHKDAVQGDDEAEQAVQWFVDHCDSPHDDERDHYARTLRTHLRIRQSLSRTSDGVPEAVRRLPDRMRLVAREQHIGEDTRNYLDAFAHELDRAIAEQGGQRVPEAPTDNGIPKLDSLCEQYNNGDLDLCALVCRVWNRAIAQSEQGSER